MASAASNTHTNEKLKTLRSSRILLACTPSILALIAANPAYAHSVKQKHGKAAPELAMAATSTAGTATSAAIGAAAQPQDQGAQSPAVTDQENARQVIIVTGIRGSLQRDLNVKRNAPGVVDAI